MKLSFQRVVIDPKRTPDEEVMVVLLRHYALSRDISERALERRLDGALQYTIFSHGTSLIMDENLITIVALWG